MEIWFNSRLSGPLHRLRTSYTRLHRIEPQKEAPAVTAEQDKDMFVRRAKSINKAWPELLGHDTPSWFPELPGHDEPSRLLAHSRGGCSCAVAQVATMLEAWTVMGRRWKTATFAQHHNKLAARIRNTHPHGTTIGP